MQNHLEVSSKSKFWTRNVRNWSKSLYGKFTESIRNLPRPPRPVQEGPYGPIRAHMGPCGPQPGPGPNPDWDPVDLCLGFEDIVSEHISANYAEIKGSLMKRIDLDPFRYICCEQSFLEQIVFP